MFLPLEYLYKIQNMQSALLISSNICHMYKNITETLVN